MKEAHRENATSIGHDILLCSSMKRRERSGGHESVYAPGFWRTENSRFWKEPGSEREFQSLEFIEIKVLDGSILFQLDPEGALGISESLAIRKANF